jgi:CBS domain-containing protein
MMLGFRLPYFGTGFTSGLWLAFVGWFLNNAALVSYRQLIAREVLEGVPVARLMTTRFDVIDADVPVNVLINEYAFRGGQRAFPVISEGRNTGVVFLTDLHRLDERRRADLRVREVARPLNEIETLRPNDDALDALNLLADNELAQAPVIREGRIAGLVRREDILSWLALHRAGPAHRSA